MSFDDLRGAFTELEVESGVPDMVFFSTDRVNRSIVRNHLAIEENRILKTREIELYLNKNNSAMILKNNLIRNILKEEMVYMIHNYSRKENLPSHYVELIRESKCIEILIKGILVKVSKIPIDHKLNSKIKDLVDITNKNIIMQTPYFRVNVIQQFIHSEVCSKYGDMFYRNLPARHMRCLLSTIRLYISLRDIVTKDSSYIQEMMKLTQIEAEKENYGNRHSDSYKINFYISGKNYVSKWRVKHMKHISYYAKEITRNSIKTIEEVYSAGNSEREIIQNLTEYYVDSNFIRPGGAHIQS